MQPGWQRLFDILNSSVTLLLEARTLLQDEVLILFTCQGLAPVVLESNIHMPL